jgi:hypothetical protein
MYKYNSIFNLTINLEITIFKIVSLSRLENIYSKMLSFLFQKSKREIDFGHL